MKLLRPRRLLAFALLVVGLAVLLGCLPTPAEPPPPPTGLLASQWSSPDYVRVVWDGMVGDVRYELQRSLYPDEGFRKLADTTTPFHEDHDITEGVGYWYRVRACAIDECGPYSEPALGYLAREGAGAPARPDGLIASQGAYTDKVRLTWIGVPRAESYHVYRAEDPEGAFEHVGTTQRNIYEDHSTSNGSLVACRPYRYRVVACNRHGCGDASEAAVGHRGTPLVGAPGDLQASDHAFPDRIRLTWHPVSGAASYRVYRGADTVLIGTTDRTTFDDIHQPQENPLDAGVRYVYRVQAVGEGDCGVGPHSVPAEGRASALPGTPIDVAITARIGEVTVRWEPGPSIIPPSYYEVLRAREREGTYELIGDVVHPDLALVDTAVTTGVYWYRVRAVNGYGWAEPSAEVPAQVP